jgi:hypothetical protein
MKIHAPTIKDLKLLTTFTILLISFNTLGVSATEDLYTENRVTLVDDEGHCIIAGLFAGNGVEEIDKEMIRYEGFLGCLIVSHKGAIEKYYEYMDSSEENEFSEILVLMPETLIVFFYIDIDSDASQAHSDSLAYEISSSYDMEIIELFSFSQDVEENELVNSLTVNIYQSPTTIEEFNSKFLQYFEKYGGYVSTVPEEQLIPGKVPDSVDGSLIFTGYLNSEYLFELIPVNQSMVSFNMDDIMSFAGYIGYYDKYENVKENLDVEPENSLHSNFSSSIKINPSDESGEFSLKISSSTVISEEFKGVIGEELLEIGVSAEFGTFTKESIQASDEEQVSLDIDISENETIRAHDENTDSNKQPEPEVTIQQPNNMWTIMQVSGLAIIIGIAALVFQKYR